MLVFLLFKQTISAFGVLHLISNVNTHIKLIVSKTDTHFFSCNELQFLCIQYYITNLYTKVLSQTVCIHIL